MSRPTPRRKRHRALRAIFAGGVGTALLCNALGSVPSTAQAAIVNRWDPGYIISDATFYNSASMTATQVQDFLNATGSSCTAGEMPCLKDFVQTTTGFGADAYCSAYTPAPNESAAQIIANIGRACGINPQVLLVMLQKETGLVRKTQPSASSYRIAMGYGCPDTAPCDAQYYGFFNQVYRSARQFKIYATSPGSFRHVAGRTNSILYNPSTSCGASNVYIQNQATASLYNYTPYQPNNAAMANLYGTGDGCSAYGNRNFWTFFTDWFGDPRTGGFSLQQTGDSTIYFAVRDRKYPIQDWGTYVAYYPVIKDPAQVGTFEGSLFPTQGAISRFVRNENTGAIYFVDNGTLYGIPSWTTFIELGGNPDTVLQLSPALISLFPQGPEMSRLIAIDNSYYYISNGQHTLGSSLEFFRQLGVTEAPVSLTGNALTAFSEGSQNLPEHVLIVTSETGAIGLWSNGGYQPLPSGASSFAGMKLQTYTMSAAVVANLPRSTGTPGLITDNAGNYYILTHAGLLQVDQAAIGSVSPQFWSLASIRSFPHIEGGSKVAIQGISDSTIRFLSEGALRAVSDMAALREQFPGQELVSYVVGSETVASLPDEGTVYASGTLVQAGSSAIYLINGNELAWLPAFSFQSAFGLAAVRSVGSDELRGYSEGSQPLQGIIRCGTEVLGGSGGIAYRIDATALGSVPLLKAADSLCSSLKVSNAATSAPVFVQKGADIYLLQNGKKHHVADMTELAQLANGYPVRTYELLATTLATIPDF